MAPASSSTSPRLVAASWCMTAVSGSDGYARADYKLGKGKGATGSYAVRADATSGGNSTSASTSFSVN